ncbi:MAG: hypothetical protein LAQ30_29885, partial [Acidobacteriia bacterium]|nr:hypothetical protein [Terriglobia bacterium]
MFGRKLPEVTEPPLQTATSVMERYSRIEGAIEIEVGNLRPLILELLAADKELQTSETAVVLNEQPSVTPAKAAKRVDAAKSAIDGAGRKLEGLRSRLLTITALAPAAYDQLLRTMPALNAAIRRDFEAEWSAAVASFSAALGKRRALEALVGEPFSLPDPSPAPVELSPEITRPHRRLAGLKASIESAHRHSPRASAKDVDPYKV